MVSGCNHLSLQESFIDLNILYESSLQGMTVVGQQYSHQLPWQGKVVVWSYRDGCSIELTVGHDQLSSSSATLKRPSNGHQNVTFSTMWRDKQHCQETKQCHTDSWTDMN